MKTSVIAAVISSLLIAVACFMLWNYSIEFAYMTRVILDEVSMTFILTSVTSLVLYRRPVSLQHSFYSRGASSALAIAVIA